MTFCAFSCSFFLVRNHFYHHHSQTKRPRNIKFGEKVCPLFRKKCIHFEANLTRCRFFTPRGINHDFLKNSGYLQNNCFIPSQNLSIFVPKFMLLSNFRSPCISLWFSASYVTIFKISRLITLEVVDLQLIRFASKFLHSFLFDRHHFSPNLTFLGPFVRLR